MILLYSKEATAATVLAVVNTNCLRIGRLAERTASHGQVLLLVVVPAEVV